MTTVWLTFRLLSTGTVQCPDAALPFAFTNPQERGFVAFSEICQTTSIDVYTGRDLVSQQQRAQLEAFALYLTRLRSDAVDLRRLRGGKGAQEVSWKDIQPQHTFGQANTESKQDRVFTRLEHHKRLPSMQYYSLLVVRHSVSPLLLSPSSRSLSLSVACATLLLQSLCAPGTRLGPTTPICGCVRNGETEGNKRE